MSRGPDYEDKVAQKYRGLLVHRMYRINRTLHEMMRDRGYKIHSGGSKTIDEIIDMDMGQFLECFHEEDKEFSQTMSGNFINDKGRVVGVIYFSKTSADKVNAKSIPVSEVTKVQKKYLGDTTLDHVIIIAEKTISPFGMNRISEQLAEYTFEVFQYEFFIENKTKHSLVPLHRRATTEEIEKYGANVSRENMMRLLTNDPIVRYYGFKEGTIVTIVRTNLAYDTSSLSSTVYKIVSRYNVENIRDKEEEERELDVMELPYEEYYSVFEGED